MTTMLIVGMLVGAVATLLVYSAYIILIAFTFWMAIDAGKQDRFWWIVLILGVPIVGSVVYFYTEKKHEYAKIESHHIHNSQTEEEHEITPKKLVKRRKKTDTEKIIVNESLIKEGEAIAKEKIGSNETRS